jgi:hypothetical protein
MASRSATRAQVSASSWGSIASVDELGQEGKDALDFGVPPLFDGSGVTFVRPLRTEVDRVVRLGGEQHLADPLIICWRDPGHVTPAFHEKDGFARRLLRNPQQPAQLANGHRTVRQQQPEDRPIRYADVIESLDVQPVRQILGGGQAGNVDRVRQQHPDAGSLTWGYLSFVTRTLNASDGGHDALRPGRALSPRHHRSPFAARA